MGISISLEGIDQLIERLELMEANAAKVEGEALRAAAQPILEEAKQTTAFIDKSGDLRKSLTVSKTKIGMGLGKSKGSTKYVLVGSFGKGVAYAKEVEFGHSSGGKGYTRAHPFLEPAFRHHKKEATAIIAQKLKEAL